MNVGTSGKEAKITPADDTEARDAKSSGHANQGIRRVACLDSGCISPCTGSKTEVSFSAPLTASDRSRDDDTESVVDVIVPSSSQGVLKTWTATCSSSPRCMQSQQPAHLSPTSDCRSALPNHCSWFENDIGLRNGYGCGESKIVPLLLHWPCVQSFFLHNGLCENMATHNAMSALTRTRVTEAALSYMYDW